MSTDRTDAVYEMDSPEIRLVPVVRLFSGADDDAKLTHNSFTSSGPVN